MRIYSTYVAEHRVRARWGYRAFVIFITVIRDAPET
jgi:hypothetical protein